jgi:hypothetical protein
MIDRNLPVEINEGTILENTCSNQIYKVVGDYRNVKTELDFDLQNINNSEDKLILSEGELAIRIANGPLRKIVL